MTHHCRDAYNSVVYYDDAWRFDCDDGLQGIEIKFCPFCGLELGGVMKKEKQPKEPKQRSFENEDQGSHQFIVSDKDQEEIAKGYDNDGPFGIGMIKGVK